MEYTIEENILKTVKTTRKNIIKMPSLKIL